MKKLLTMLLALSVVFTYTFGAAGSVFAAETPAQQIDAKAIAQQKVIDDAVKAQLDAVVYGQNGYLFAIVGGSASDNQKLLTAAALEAGATAAKAAGANAIAEVVRAQKLANAYTESEFTAITAETIYNVAAYTNQFNAEKAAKDVEIAKVDANVYVAIDYDPATGDQSDKATVAADIANKKTALNAIKIADTDDASEIAGKIVDVKAITVTTPAKTAAEYQKDLDDAKTAAKKAINDQAETLKTSLKNTYKAAVDSATTPSAKAEAEAKLAAVDGNVARVAEIYLAKVDAVKIDEDTKPGTGAGTVDAAVTAVKVDALAKLNDEASLNAVLSQLSNVDGLVAVANDKATAYKAERDTDGTIKYDGAVVDKALADVVAKVKAGTYTSIAQVNGASEWAAMVSIKNTAEALVAYKNTKKSDVDAILTTGYAASEADKIDDLKKAAKEAIEAAADTDAVDAIMKKLAEDIAALPTLLQTEALANAATSVITTLEYNTALDRLFDATVLGAAVGTYDNAPATKTAILNAAKKVMVDAVLAGIDATKTYTNADVESIVKANYDAAKAVITGMPTVAAVEAQVADVIAKIDAIPSTVTIADKATVVAADKAYEALKAVAAYATLPTAKKVSAVKENNLTAAKTVIKNLENTAACDAVKALKTKASLTADDEAAYEAAKALSDAYYEEYSAYASNAEITNIVTDLANIKAAIENSKYVAAAKAIEAIPAEVTKDDKVVVEAARAAYDALSDAQKTTFSKSLLKVLEDAEATIAELTKYTAKDAKINLYEASKATSYTKPTKNSVKLTAKADLTEAKENGYTVKYSFYQKGPKKTTYKLWKTTTSDNYTFKGLKKGTHYFKVKVSVYDAEGNLVASKYTNYRYLKIK